MTDKNELIIQPDDFSANALNAIQQKGAFHPDVITDKKQFQPVYDDYQFVRKFRIAIEKKSKELITIEKKSFESFKKIYNDEEKRILAIIKPIETKLLDTRTAWEERQKEIAKKKACDLAAEQQAEFNRCEIIRVWDSAHGMNIDFDWRKAEDAAKDYALKWYEAHEENAEFDARKEDEVDYTELTQHIEEIEIVDAITDAEAKKLAAKMVEPTPEAKEELEKQGVHPVGQGVLKSDYPELSAVLDEIDDDQEEQNQLDKVVDDPHGVEDDEDDPINCPKCGHQFHLAGDYPF